MILRRPAMAVSVAFRIIAMRLLTNYPIRFKCRRRGWFFTSVLQQWRNGSVVVRNLDCLLCCRSMVAWRGGLENEAVNRGKDEDFADETRHCEWRLGQDGIQRMSCP